MPRTRLLRFALALGVLLLPLLGCTNPFTPANPEPPSGDAVAEEFGSIEDLLHTMEAAIQARSTEGANAYIHALAESTVAGQRAFRAFHDPGAKAAWLSGAGGQPAPEPWLLLNERGLYSELSRIRPNDAYIFQFSPDDGPDGHGNDEEIATDVWSVHRHYELFATPANTDPVTIAAGFADMLIQKDGARWSIFEWHDRVDPKYGVNPPDQQRSFTYYRLESQ
jgi:hypothetical protein